MKRLAEMSVEELIDIKKRGYYFSYSFTAVNKDSTIPYDGDESSDENRDITIQSIQDSLRSRGYSFTPVRKFIRYINASVKETLTIEASVWFRSLSINEQNHYMDKDFPNRDRSCVIQVPSNITEMYLINKETL
jgi:hypothetical protein